MKIFELFGEIFIDNSGADESLDKTDSKAKKITQSLGKGIASAAKWGAAIGAGAIAAGGAMLAAGNKFAETTDRIDKLSQRLGLSREGFQEWEFVLSQSGVAIDSMQSGMKTLSQRMGQALDGAGKGAELFDQLRVTITESMTQEEAFNATIAALQGMEDGVEKARLAQELFGKSGQELLPLLNASAEATEEMKAQAQEMGLVIGDEAIDAGVKFADTMDQLKRQFQATATGLMSDLMPMIQDFLDLVMDNMPMIKNVISAVFSTFKTVISAVIPLLTQLIKTILPPLITVIMELISTVLPVLVNLFTMLVTTILPPLNQLFTTMLTTILPPLVEVLTIIINEVLPPLIELFIMLIETVLPPLLEIFTTLIETLLPPLIELFVMIIENVLPIVIELFTMLIETVLPPFMELIEVIVNDILPPLLDLFMDLAENILPIVMDVFKVLITVVEPIMHAIADVIGVVLALIKGDWEGVWEGIKSFFGNILDAIINLVSGFGDLFAPIFQGIADVVMGIWDGLVAGIKAAINFIIGGINAFIRGINKIEIPDWVPGVGGKGLNIKEIPLLAEGGDVIDAGRVIVGEAGPEMLDLPRGARVTPLSSAGMSENEEMMARSGGVNQTVNIYSPTPLSPAKVAKETKKASRRLALEFA